MLTSEGLQAAAKSRVAEIHQLEERVRAAEEDSEALHATRADVEELTAEHESLTMGTEHAKAEHDTLDDHICELEVSAAPCHGGLGDFVQAMQLLKSSVAAGEDRETGEVRACQMLEKMSELRELVEDRVGQAWWSRHALRNSSTLN